MDSRIHQIIETLKAYSTGNFDEQMEIGENSDEIEACIQGLNMLGDELKDLTQHKVFQAILETEEKTKNELSKNLHDSLGQKLSTMIFYFKTIAEEETFREIHDMVGLFIEHLLEMHDEMRNICFDLMPAVLEEEGLLPALRELSNDYLLRCDVNIHINTISTISSRQKSVEINIYRVVQEFITNALNHGQAKNIHINLKQENQTLEIELTDDGRGFSQSGGAKKGNGLRNVRSRIRSYGGHIDIHSSPGTGTAYLISIPQKITHDQQ